MPVAGTFLAPLTQAVRRVHVDHAFVQSPREGRRDNGLDPVRLDRANVDGDVIEGGENVLPRDSLGRVFADAWSNQALVQVKVALP